MKYGTIHIAVLMQRNDTDDKKQVGRASKVNGVQC